MHSKKSLQEPENAGNCAIIKGMINLVPTPDTGSTIESPEQAPGILARMTTGFRQTMWQVANVASDVFWHGIALETRPFVTPEIQKNVMKTYEENLAAFPDDSIRNMVKAMLKAIKTHYPNQVKRSIPWMRVRAHFFEKIGLWGKTG